MRTNLEASQEGAVPQEIINMESSTRKRGVLNHMVRGNTREAQSHNNIHMGLSNAKINLSVYILTHPFNPNEILVKNLQGAIKLLEDAVSASDTKLPLEDQRHQTNNKS